MPQLEFELKLAGGKVVKWHGTDAENAAVRYVDCHREATVTATRPVTHGVFVLGSATILQPGDRGW